MSRSNRSSGRTGKSRPTGARPIAVGVLPNLIGYNIRRAQIALWRDFSRTVGHREIRPAVFSLLILVEANPGIAQIELAEQLDIDKAAIVGLIHRLQRNEWVVRRRSQEDRRRQGIFLTARGQDFLDKFRARMLEHEKRFTRLFTREELAQLFAYLRRIHP
ncbi:MAG TPA: MarR family winged helix-turn-helix transcriptional regulator [Steroidobacteraceae bacterium]